MNNPVISGITLNKEYAKERFLPMDLQYEVAEVSRDFTLSDLFLLIETAEKMIPGISSALGMCKFKLFLEQTKSVDHDIKANQISSLVLYWPAIEFNDGRQTVQNLMGCKGISNVCPYFLAEDDHSCDENCPQFTPFDISLSPIPDLANVPIVMDTSVVFKKHYENSDENNSPNRTYMFPTLWCLITSILWEITFIGNTPEERESYRTQELDD